MIWTAFGLFHRDNVMLHFCGVAIVKFHGLGYELLYHFPYFLDLASSNCLLFTPSLKKCHNKNECIFGVEIIVEPFAFLKASINPIIWKE